MYRLPLSLWVSILLVLSIGLTACHETQENHWADLLTAPSEPDQSVEIRSHSENEATTPHNVIDNLETITFVDVPPTSSITFMDLKDIKDKEKGWNTATPVDYHIEGGPEDSRYTIEGPLYHAQGGSHDSEYHPEKLYHIANGQSQSEYFTEIVSHITTGSDASDYENGDSTTVLYHLDTGPLESSYTPEDYFHATNSPYDSEYFPVSN